MYVASMEIIHFEKPYPVMGLDFQKLKPAFLDLSDKNERLKEIDLDDDTDFEAFIHAEIKREHGDYGIGGYLENRVIYRRSAHFESDESSRSIHLGVDVWMPSETPVYAPLDGVVHSFGINDNYADYGGTLILQHIGIDGIFWTLYGHISHASLEGLAEGDEFKRGEIVARLGNWDENGNWPSHLHFQVILDLLDNSADFPGVCRTEETEFFKNICPDPMMYL
jgi:murein DD-endopeptidase MepM/ murein hydrolase activator NlpD